VRGPKTCWSPAFSTALCSGSRHPPGPRETWRLPASPLALAESAYMIIFVAGDKNRILCHSARRVPRAAYEGSKSKPRPFAWRGLGGRIDLTDHAEQGYEDIAPGASRRPFQLGGVGKMGELVHRRQCCCDRGWLWSSPKSIFDEDLGLVDSADTQPVTATRFFGGLVRLIVTDGPSLEDHRHEEGRIRLLKSIQPMPDCFQKPGDCRSPLIEFSSPLM
jgi:hypothetical protein